MKMIRMAVVVLLCVLLTSCATTRATAPPDKKRQTVCYQEGTTDPPVWYRHPAFGTAVAFFVGVSMVGTAWIMKTELEQRGAP